MEVTFDYVTSHLSKWRQRRNRQAPIIALQKEPLTVIFELGLHLQDDNSELLSLLLRLPMFVVIGEKSSFELRYTVDGSP